LDGWIDGDKWWMGRTVGDKEQIVGIGRGSIG